MKEADWLVVRKTLNVKSWSTIARRLDISERNLRRYRRGELAVPRVVQLALEGLLCRELHSDREVRLEKPQEMSAAALLRRVR
jgi:hypothetical protein